MDPPSPFCELLELITLSYLLSGSLFACQIPFRSEEFFNYILLASLGIRGSHGFVVSVGRDGTFSIDSQVIIFLSSTDLRNDLEMMRSFPLPLLRFSSSFLNHIETSSQEKLPIK